MSCFLLVLISSSFLCGMETSVCENTILKKALFTMEKKFKVKDSIKYKDVKEFDEKIIIKKGLTLAGKDDFWTIKVPFEYKTLNKKEALEIPLLGEGYYFPLADKDNIIIGPLSPCMMVLLTDGEHAIVFHRSWRENDKYLITQVVSY